MPRMLLSWCLKSLAHLVTFRKMATITDLSALRRWFMGNMRSGKAAPYWTLYVGDYGDKEKVVQFNDRVDDLEESFGMLARTIQDMNNPAGVRFRVMQVDTPRGNNPVATVHVQLFAGNGAAGVAPAGIGSLPGEYLSKTEAAQMVAAAVAAAKKEMEFEAKIQALEDQVNSSTQSWVTQAIEVVNEIGKSPLGMALMAKLTGMPMPAMMPPSMGAPAADSAAGGAPAAGDTFDDDLNAVCDTTGLNDVELMRRLRRFAETNPEMARQLMNQIQ